MVHLSDDFLVSSHPRVFSGCMSYDVVLFCWFSCEISAQFTLYNCIDMCLGSNDNQMVTWDNKDLLIHATVKRSLSLFALMLYNKEWFPLMSHSPYYL